MLVAHNLRLRKHALVQQYFPRDIVRDAFAAWVNAESGRFILFLPVFMAAGVVAYFAWPSEPQSIPAWLMAAILLGAGLLGAGFMVWPRPLVQGGLLFAAFAVLGFAVLGFASAWHAASVAPPWVELPRRATIVSGRIAGLDILPEGRRVTLDGVSLDGGGVLARTVRIRLRNNDAGAWQPGDRVRVRALLRAPSPPGYPGGWDTQRDAYFSGVAGYGFALGPAALLEGARDPPRLGWQRLRSAIAARILAGLPGVPGAIAATLLTGMATAIPPADRMAFQASGLAHLLAVAGLHIGIVMGLAFALCRRAMTLSEHAALFWPVKAIAAVAALLAGAFYLALTGAHVPILRSFTMACLVTLALLTGRRAVSFRALALAATALMLAAPALTMGVSFQMSFCAVLALLAGWDALRPLMSPLHRTGFWRRAGLHGAGLLVTSALAGTASLPVAAYHFGNATAYYVPANMLAVPLTALWIMPWGMAALALMPVGLERLALAPMGWGIEAVIWIARGVAAWPDASVPMAQIPPAALLTCVAGLIWLCLWRSRARLAGMALMAAGLAIAMLARAPDLVVGPGAKLIAARVGGAVYVSAASGGSRFDRETPARVWGIAGARDFPGPGQTGPAGDGIRCDAMRCAVLVRGLTAIVTLDAQAPCAAASVIVSHVRIFCPGVPIVDGLSTQSQGAASIWLTARGPVIWTDAQARGDRPWVLQRANTPAAPSMPLPPALTE